MQNFEKFKFSKFTFQEREDELDRWNQLFKKDLETFTQLPTDRIINPKHISLVGLRIIGFISRFSKYRVIYKMGNPRIISDKYPECLLYTLEMLGPAVTEVISASSKNEFTIVVHIRHGELVLSQFKDRLLPLSHYEQILGHIVPVLESANIKYSLPL